MRTRSLFVSSVLGVALLGLAGSASAAPAVQIPTSYTYSQVDPIAPVTLNVSCPTVSGYSHKLLTGGSFSASGFAINENRMVGSSWQVSAFNTTDYAQDITVYANCLYWSGTPNATVKTTNAKATTITAGKTVSQTSSCGSGTVLLSGGYLSEVTNAQVPVFSLNGGSGNGWKVTGVNNTSAKHTLSTQVNCLSGWSFTKVVNKKTVTYKASSSQTTPPNGEDEAEGMAWAVCGSGTLASGAGWNVVAHNNFPYQCVPSGATEWICDMDYYGDGEYGDPSSLAYAECLTAPTP
jgi:hypothetical protein